MPEPAAPPADPDAPDTGEGGQPGTDWQAEADKWKALARKHEGQAKANAAAAQRLATIEDEQTTETQRAAETSSR